MLHKTLTTLTSVRYVWATAGQGASKRVGK